MTRSRDLLGRGGMGEVYRATDTRTGETVAVKALNPDVLVRNLGLLERFVREGEALRRLNHPNIVHLVSACEEDGRHYLVMEYVGGGSLEGLLRSQSRLPPAHAIEIGIDLADALEHVPSPRHHPPRPQAGQRADHRRHAEAGRFRYCACGERPRVDPNWHPDGHGGLSKPRNLSGRAAR